MPLVCCTSGTLYKGLFILVVFLIALEYLFGSLTETKHFFVFNATRFSPQEKYQHSPLMKTLLFKNNNKPMTVSSGFNVSSYPTLFDISVTPPRPPASEVSTVSFDVAGDESLVKTAKNVNASDRNNSRNDSIVVETTVSQSPPVDSVDSRSRTERIPTVEGSSKNNGTVLPPCPEMPPNLRGRIPVVKSPVPTVLDLEERFGSWLMPGGHWSPSTCRAAKKVALVIPFRCRGEHLLLFLQHMHPFLKRQQLDYTIFIVEQKGDGPFNRAMLMNIGYKEALTMRTFDCFIFHDIDLLPEDDRNLYTCPPEQPRHMSVAVDIFKYKLPYSGIFGGVSAISREHFQLLNGFSNSFWGWGGEDDDMSNRIRYHNLYISRYPLSIARYTMLTHKKDKPSPNRYDVLKNGVKRFDKDGLNSLKYTLVEKKKHLLYTWILVSVDVPS